MIQTACDRCTQGVMDADNPHLTGSCTCSCHLTKEELVAALRDREEYRRG